MAGGAAVLAAAAIGGGLVLAGGDPDVPGEDDVHASAPDCAVVPESAVAEALTDAVVESAESGPRPGGHTTVCAWTSLGRAEAPGTLRVEFSALFTDTSGEEPVSGVQHTEGALAAVVPRGGDEVVLGAHVAAHVWAERAPGTAGLAFQADNLLVRVAYSGVSGGDPVEWEDARETAVRVAERLVEAV
ncbi:hypothetical protein BJF83_05895 [Nocardiopsis sp. CNR-923]|nr:hypothetical protein BJF83_05895 [Nocardiopsis sp. CNR-923]